MPGSAEYLQLPHVTFSLQRCSGRHVFRAMDYPEGGDHVTVWRYDPFFHRVNPEKMMNIKKRFSQNSGIRVNEELLDYGQRQKSGNRSGVEDTIPSALQDAAAPVSRWELLSGC